MEIKVVVPERLLDHEKVEPFEVGEETEVLKCVGGVGVAGEKYVGPAIAYAVEYFDVPLRFDLQLDAPIAGTKLGCNLAQQLLDGVLDADGDAAFDLSVCPADQL